MKDYRLEITVKNNAVLKRMEELGYYSIPEFCRKKQLSYHAVVQIVAFKVPFYGKRGRINGTITKLADALQVLPDYIYPPERREAPLQRNKYIVETNKADLMGISTSLRMDALPVDDRKMLNDFGSTLHRIMIEGLSPREHKILDMRFGLTSGTPETIYQVGKALNVSSERIKQVEAKALQKLKHPAESKELREYRELLADLNT